MSTVVTSCWVWLAIGCLALLLIGMRWFRRKPQKLSPLSRSERWVARGLCHACGYNLTGVESYQCPECGTVRFYSARQWKAKVAAQAQARSERPTSNEGRP
jgi:hypothetical protein